MAEIVIAPYIRFEEAAVEALYESVGWTSYLRWPGLLREAYAASLKTLAAHDGETLAGIIRAVGDGVSILYIQDVIVHPAYQRRGIGTRLMQEMLECYPDVNQVVLLTDDTEETRRFYEAAGFRESGEAGCCAMLRLHRIYG